jgi:DNA mismatch repair protein MSH6
LAIIDELGRGTATYDGMALAHSVLNFLITKINCKCFFATHYHSLTEEFASMPGTCLKMMDYEIISGEEDRIDFLYKLVSGKAEKSFGLNVAQLVGLPKELIR